MGKRRGEAYTGFCCGNLRERDHLEDPGVDRRIILKWIFRKWYGRAWTGLIWIGTLVNTVMNLKFHKMWGISLLAENRSASQEEVCSME